MRPLLLLMRSLIGSKTSVAGFLLEGDHEAGTQDQADLFYLHPIALLAVAKHLQDNKDILVEVLEFRTLARVQDVFQHERVHRETVAESLQDLNLMDAVHVDPRY